MELKNGETVFGKLSNCDSWMNLTLTDVIYNYNNGEKFNKLEEIYVRGNHIKFLRLPDTVMEQAKEQNMLSIEQRNRTKGRRGPGNFQKRNNNDYGRENRTGGRNSNSSHNNSHNNANNNNNNNNNSGKRNFA